LSLGLPCFVCLFVCLSISCSHPSILPYMTDSLPTNRGEENAQHKMTSFLF
jgi:hypothetical protein